MKKKPDYKDNCMLCGCLDKAELPKYKDWIKELKLDGDRSLYVKGRFIGRRGFDWTRKYPHIKIQNNCVLDGELVYFTDGKKHDFDLARQKQNWSKVTYVIFDVLELDGTKLTDKRLIERREKLKDIKGSGIKTILEFESVEWDEVEKQDYEGLILKNPDSKYVFERSKDWLKVKNYKVSQFKVMRIEMSENNSKVAIIDNNGQEQRVRVDGRDYKEGDTIDVKYLAITREGRLRQPTVA